MRGFGSCLDPNFITANLFIEDNESVSSHSHLVQE